jgi:integrase
VVDAEVGPDGQRRQRKRGGFRTQTEAEVALRAYLADRDAGRTAVSRSARTVAEWLEEWLETKKGSVKPTTLESYRYAIRALIVPHLGGLRLQDVRPVHLQRLYTTLSTEGGARRGALKPRSVRLAHQVLRPAFGHAVDLGLLATNPAASKLVLPRIERREMTVWSAEEARGFLKATAEDRLGAMWRLVITTGLRRGEALGLRWVDIDFELRHLSISQNLVMVRGKPTMSSPKGEPRQVSLPRTTADALRRQRIRQDKDRLLAGPAWFDSGLVFTTGLGGPLDPNNVYDSFVESCRRVGVPVIRLHDGRHTAATLALQAGAHPKLVQEMLGHASIEMTLDTYSHVVPGMHREVADRIEAILNGGKTGGEATHARPPARRDRGREGS